MSEYLIQAVLNRIENEMARLYWNNNQKDILSPFGNYGTEYSNDVFTVRAYNWNEDNDNLPNFEYKNFKVWWYKHSMRGLNWEYNCGKNVLPQAQFFTNMLEDCINSMIKDFKKNKNGGLQI